MATGNSRIIYTRRTRRLLATCAFLPSSAPRWLLLSRDRKGGTFLVSARVIAEFSDYLAPEQRLPNTLQEIGKENLEPDANIIKLPNISVFAGEFEGLHQEFAIIRLRCLDYPKPFHNDENRRFVPATVKRLGSAVNPVLREGTDRRHPLHGQEFRSSIPTRWGNGRFGPADPRRPYGARGFLPRRKVDDPRPSPAGCCMELIARAAKTTVLKPGVKLLEARSSTRCS